MGMVAEDVVVVVGTTLLLEAGATVGAGDVVVGWAAAVGWAWNSASVVNRRATVFLGSSGEEEEEVEEEEEEELAVVLGVRSTLSLIRRTVGDAEAIGESGVSYADFMTFLEEDGVGLNGAVVATAIEGFFSLFSFDSILFLSTLSLLATGLSVILISLDFVSFVVGCLMALFGLKGLSSFALSTTLPFLGENITKPRYWIQITRFLAKPR